MEKRVGQAGHGKERIDKVVIPKEVEDEIEKLAASSNLFQKPTKEIKAVIFKMRNLGFTFPKISEFIEKKYGIKYQNSTIQFWFHRGEGV